MKGWVLESCPDKEECAEGMIYCRSCKCEEPCEHDKLCPQCHGYGWVVRRAVTPFDIMGGNLYPTRAAAMREIDWGPEARRQQ